MPKTLPLTLIILLLLWTYPLSIYSSPYSLSEEKGKLKVEVIYELTLRESKEVVIGSRSEMKFIAPPPPKGFEIGYTYLKCEEGLPKFVKVVGADKVREVEGTVKSAIRRGGELTLRNSGPLNITLNLDLLFAYIKSLTVKPSGREFSLEVKRPEEPFSQAQMYLYASIDNKYPYAFSDILLPNGTSLLSVDVQRRLEANDILLDLHHVRIRLGGSLPYGKYTFILKGGDYYSLPYSFILKEGTALNESIPPYSCKEVNFPKGIGEWKVIGYLLAIYGPKKLNEGVLDVKGTLVDYVYSGGNNVEVRAASYLVPPLEFGYWLDVYVVYGSWFKVENKGSSSLSLTYIPLTIKPLGEWEERGLVLTLRKVDVMGARRAYLVVQLPSYGEIKAVIGPGKKDLTKYFESKVKIMEEERGVSILGNQMYIEVGKDEALSSASYTVLIRWKKLTVKALDSKGRPLKGAQVILEGPKELTALTNSDGLVTLKVYAPGNYLLKVKFKGSEVYEWELNEPYGYLEVPCKVYDISIVTVGLMGQPLGGSSVVLRKTGGGIVAIGRTDKRGMIILREVPSGTYDLVISYKRFKMIFSNVTVESPLTLKAGLDVLFEIPYFNVPISLKEAIGALGVPIATLLVRKAVRREEEEEVITAEG
ncbi:MAG: hypothetical protein B6U69_01250 [Thermofilum sp. ex4484_15]|nr:MAG: hypothetical protein B6U69_01250 [Thermofilum sp. ex4484_15]